MYAIRSYYGDGFGIDQVMGHEGLNFLQGHPFLNGSFHANQPHAKLIFTKFANGTNTAVAQMVDRITSYNVCYTKLLR